MAGWPDRRTGFHCAEPLYGSRHYPLCRARFRHRHRSEIRAVARQRHRVVQPDRFTPERQSKPPSSRRKAENERVICRSMPSENEIARQIVAWARANSGDAQAEVSAVTALPGHAGQSYSFELDSSAGGTSTHERLVLRLAPEGVRIAGPADVVRQARIMQSL